MVGASWASIVRRCSGFGLVSARRSFAPCSQTTTDSASLAFHRSEHLEITSNSPSEVARTMGHGLFPPELERKIFELAVHDQPLCILNLMLIAWRAKEWTVRHLLIGVLRINGIEFRQGFQNLASVAGLPLTRLYCDLTALFDGVADLTHPLFSNITHLEVFYLGNGNTAGSGFALIPHLSHLSFQGYNYRETKPAPLTLLQKCRSLRVLIYLRRNADIGAHTGADDYWARAKAFIAKRPSKYYRGRWEPKIFPNNGENMIIRAHACGKIMLFVHETHSQELRPACRIAWNMGNISKENFDVHQKVIARDSRRSKYHAGHAAMEVETFFLPSLPRSLSDRHVLSDFPHNHRADTVRHFVYLVRYGSSGGADVYHENCQDDRATIKLLVYGLVLVDVLQTVMVTADGFHWFVYGFRNLAQLNDTFLNSWDVPVLDSVIAIVVQTFYCWRIYFLRKGIVIPAAVFLCGHLHRYSNASIQFSVYSFGFISVNEQGHQMGHLSLLTKNAVGETLVGGAVADIAIATVLSGTLLRERSYSLPSNRSMISRLIRLIVEPNALTAGIAVIAVILFWACPGTAAVAPPIAIIGKLYTNCLLALFNNRTKESNTKMNSHGMASLHLPPNAKTRTTTATASMSTSKLVLHFFDKIHDAAPDRATRSSEPELNLAEISIIVKSGEEEGVTKPRVLDIVPLDGNLQWR
ncbi:hypothetical protein B0H13DRAFT_1868303 [Mycena leptocephala]|nr:hypothetical protein B0H13DRAFT_1868303 [Mycena leptocephala]